MIKKLWSIYYYFYSFFLLISAISLSLGNSIKALLLTEGFTMFTIGGINRDTTLHEEQKEEGNVAIDILLFVFLIIIIIVILSTMGLDLQKIIAIFQKFFG